MDILTCNVCGGDLVMQPDDVAVCDHCGAKYSLASLQKSAREIYAAEYVMRWNTVMRKRMASDDYEDAEHIVKGILVAAPQDKEANALYNDLAVWKYLTIINGALIGYTGHAKKLVLPPSVTHIWKEVFENSTLLQEITLPDGIKSIGERAFDGCHSLQKVVIPNSLTRIEGGAFGSCISLQNIIIPAGITKIEYYAFAMCVSLQNITIPNGVTNIECGAFYGCQSLQRIIIPNGVTEIGDSAFSDCTALQSITIPDSVVKIGKYAFRDCSSLQNVVCPNRFVGSFKDTPWWKKFQEETESAKAPALKGKEKVHTIKQRIEKIESMKYGKPALWLLHLLVSGSLVGVLLGLFISLIEGLSWETFSEVFCVCFIIFIFPILPTCFYCKNDTEFEMSWKIYYAVFYGGMVMSPHIGVIGAVLFTSVCMCFGYYLASEEQEDRFSYFISAIKVSLGACLYFVIVVAEPIAHFTVIK